VTDAHCGSLHQRVGRSNPVTLSVIIDLDRRISFARVMNKMAPGGGTTGVFEAKFNRPWQSDCN